MGVTYLDEVEGGNETKSATTMLRQSILIHVRFSVVLWLNWYCASLEVIRNYRPTKKKRRREFRELI